MLSSPNVLVKFLRKTSGILFKASYETFLIYAMLSIKPFTLSKLWPYNWKILSIFWSSLSNSNNCGAVKNLVTKLDLYSSISVAKSFNCCAYFSKSLPTILIFHPSNDNGQLTGTETNTVFVSSKLVSGTLKVVW